MMRTVSQLVEHVRRGYFGFSAGETWSPAVNLYENDDAYVVCVDLAGVEHSTIEVVATPGRLLIRGQRPAPVRSEYAESRQHYTVHLMEIDHGSFSREVELPSDVVTDDISATYRNGMLWMELPKKQ
jgi:HSP20 family protein